MDLNSNLLRLGNFSMNLLVRTGYKNYKDKKYYNQPFSTYGNSASLRKSAYICLNYNDYELKEDDPGRQGNVTFSSWDLSEIRLLKEEVDFVMNNFDEVVDSYENPDREGEMMYQLNPEYRQALTIVAKSNSTLGFQPTLFKRRSSDEQPTLGGYLIIEKNACVVTMTADEWLTFMETLVDSIKNLNTLSNSLITTYLSYETTKRKMNPSIFSKVEEE